ncbi:MAG: bifunctional nuclease family protein [Spirochaetes bacterium]|nr:bifunctional nuclease family protein [Spirochaetota bacterium]
MLVPAEVWTVAKAEQGNAVLIRPVGSDMAVPIFIGPAEAQSILIGLGNVQMPRPLTHDLLITVAKNLQTTINRIEITELKEGTFYGRLILQREDDEISIDSRPSDCISIAVRVKCPIYIDEGVVDEAGISVDVVNQKPISRSVQTESELSNLKHMLDIAVAEENYEEAARLRDQIKELEEKL